MFFIMKKLTRLTSAVFHFNLSAFESKLNFINNKKTIHNITHKTDKQNKKMRSYIERKISFNFIACFDFSFNYFLLCLLYFKNIHVSVSHSKFINQFS